APPARPAATGPPPGIVRRAMSTNRHLLGLLFGALLAWTRDRRARGDRRGPRYLAAWLLSGAARPFLRRDLVDAPFPVQFRRRLEMLGPTYIKLGQILSLREDILPPSVTTELRSLLNRLPVIPFAQFTALVERDLERPVDRLYSWIDPEPLASASIAQIHRATTLDGMDVVIKAVKPGVAETLRRDARLLRILGAGLQTVIPRYQPKRIINEFCEYTLREVDLRREADNAESFAANFHDLDDVVFPAIDRHRSGLRVLTMEYLDGMRPDSAEAMRLAHETRERLVDLGAESIIRMLYRDGFFHADLHPGNLLILPGPKVGFIDLGMVGRFESDLRRALLYYYYSLVTGDHENAARYLAAVAEPGRDGDPAGFRRDVSEISARWHRASSFESFSLAQLVLESVTRGAEYRMYFPVELVLMVKALVTFEGVGHVLLPDFDVAEVSRRHIRRVFLDQFSPLRFVHEGLRGAPDLLDAAVKLPSLITEGVRVLERSTRPPPENPLKGVRATLLAGFCLVAGAILMAFGAAWPLWGVLYASAVLLAFRRGS
ncbi:MAG: AarF/ABC1/UbiB kinase family protein, partial [Gemmatimonadota bacterium]|nr:AarF/ABC1/UbiB kinase family protein [Gemmatimonadota bacterium]